MTPTERWDAYLPLAEAEAGKQGRKVRWVPTEDLRQAACLGLWKAARGWEEARGVPFPLYARRLVRWELLDCCWRACFWGHWANRQAHEDGFELPRVRGAVSLAARIDPGYGAVDDADLLDCLLSRLGDARIREVVRRYWLAGEPNASIARRLGVTVWRVQQLNLEGRRLLGAMVTELARGEAA